MDKRTEWAGLFHRKKQAAGMFMTRLSVEILNPNSLLITPLVKLGPCESWVSEEFTFEANALRNVAFRAVDLLPEGQPCARRSGNWWAITSISMLAVSRSRHRLHLALLFVLR